MRGRRVAITGLGAVTSIGIGKETLWRNVLNGTRAGAPITRFDASPFASHVAAEIHDFDPHDHLEAKKTRRLDRFSQFGLVAARMAVADARLCLERENRDRVGTYIGSALGGIAFGEAQHADFVTTGIRHVSPTVALTVFGGASAANVAMDLGATGPSAGNANSCASGTIGIGDAFHAIKSGALDVAIAGGAEAPLAPLTFGAFDIIKVLSSRNDTPDTASRPFDKDRDGFVMGEGAGIVILEDYEHAAKRGAHIYGEVRGFGMTSDAYHMTAPRPDGAQAARAIALAIEEAEIMADDIDYVAAHASSTVLNDSTETIALKRALGVHAHTVPISGTKGMHAHALGASGAIETVITTLAMEQEILPATVNLFQTAPDCDLSYIRDEPLKKRVSHVLKNSFGFGGVNAALVLSRAS